MTDSRLIHGSSFRVLLSILIVLALPEAALADRSGPDARTDPGPHHPVVVTDGTVTLTTLPDFNLELAEEFTHLGSTSFPLGERAVADVFLFAEKSGDDIRRLVTIQVESLTDDTASDYHWEGEETIRVGSAEYLLGFWCFDAAEVAREQPASDTAMTYAWLGENGHRRSGVFVGTRLARVFANGRSELLIFYGETVALTGVDCEDEEGAMEHLPGIIARAEAAYELGGE